MRIKRVSIKDYLVRVRKKNKKQGRPSKAEIAMSAIMSWELKKPKNQEAIRKSIDDLFAYGIGIVEVTP